MMEYLGSGLNLETTILQSTYLFGFPKLSTAKMQAWKRQMVGLRTWEFEEEDVHEANKHQEWVDWITAIAAS